MCHFSRKKINNKNKINFVQSVSESFQLNNLNQEQRLFSVATFVFEYCITIFLLRHKYTLRVIINFLQCSIYFIPHHLLTSLQWRQVKCSLWSSKTWVPRPQTQETWKKWIRIFDNICNWKKWLWCWVGNFQSVIHTRGSFDAFQNVKTVFL